MKTNIQIDGFHLRYVMPMESVHNCWSINSNMQNAKEDMFDLFDKTPQQPLSVWIEHWEKSLLKETIHLFPDTHGEGQDI